MSEPAGRLRNIDAVIFDLDGVVTRTARVHAAAWKQTFDPLLARAGKPAPDTFLHAAKRLGATLVVRDLGELERAA